VPVPCRGGDRHRHGRGSLETRSRRARAEIRQRGFPGAHPARCRARPAVPVHLAALAQPRRARARPGHWRGALRQAQGPRGPASLPAHKRKGPAAAARTR